MGLNLVQKLSERWGLERSAASGTRVWAQLSCAAVIEPASQTLSGPAGTAPAHENGRQTSGHHAAGEALGTRAACPSPPARPRP